MSVTQQTAVDESCQNWKLFLLPAEKPGEIFRRSVKGALGVFLLCSCLFFLHSAFSGKSLWRCPEYVAVDRNSGDLKDHETTDISHLVFGIAGSVGTWEKRRQYVDLWWKPKVTRGFVWLDEKPPKNAWPVTSPPYRVSEDTSRFKSLAVSRSAVRIARIVSESYRIGLENVRWFVMGDDDTVFFTENLVGVLSKYDHEKLYYIGGISESVEQVVMHSYGMAFGGGGFAISYGLAAELDRVLDGCLDRYAHFYGSDQRVHACLTELGVPLTREPGFHQVDIRGDPYGLLAAHPIAPLVSLHHLDSVKPLVPFSTQLDAVRLIYRAARVDSARTLQHTFCYNAALNWSVSVSWGYTVQIYSSILTAKDLATPLQTFRSWRTFSNGPFTFNTRPLKEDVCERPVVFYLDRVQSIGRREIASLYKRYVPESWRGCNQEAYTRAAKIETVTVFSPKMEQAKWHEAPHRECCKIDRKVGKKAFQVRIQTCNPGEAVSPP